MFYVYPQLSRYDLGLIRIGGPGLGNLLFPFAEAIALAKKENFQIIWPTWGQLKVGPLIRREKDKRTYFTLFKSTEDYIHDWRKAYLLLRCNIMSKEKYIQYKSEHIQFNLKKDTIIVCTGMRNLFSDIIMDHELIGNELEKICRTKKQFRKNKFVGVHIRLGDFKNVPLESLTSRISNARLPMEWYIEKIEQVREICGRCIDIRVFSDATDDEIKDVLSLPGVVRADYGNSVNDLLGLSQSSILIASNSSFSMWASYLGRMPVIWYKDLMKQRLYYGADSIKEIDIGLGEQLPETFCDCLLVGGKSYDI